jgi:lactoylglutathione lyase
MLTAILPHRQWQRLRDANLLITQCSPGLVSKQCQRRALSEHEVRMIVLSTDDLDESIRFYSENLGMPVKFRDGAHFAALDGGPITIALATALDHPIPGLVVVGIKTDDVDAAARAVEASGGGIVTGPYDDAHERRAVVYDNKGNGLVFYSPLAR